MSLYCSVGSPETDLSPQQLKDLLVESLAKLGARNNVLAVPPDQSREHSQAGELTRYAWEHYGDRLKAVLPAIGTHTPMRPDQIAHMFGDMPQGSFPRAQLAHGYRDAGRGAGGVHPRAVGGQAELHLAGAGEQAHLAGRLRPDSLDRPGGAARSDRHGQLHQEHSRRHGRARRHQSQPLPGRGLRHGADHGPRR